MNLAEHAHKVYGVEIVPEAIVDAKGNAQLNHIDNVDFEVGNAEEWMAKWESQGINPDVIMVDPQRSSHESEENCLCELQSGNLSS